MPAMHANIITAGTLQADLLMTGTFQTGAWNNWITTSNATMTTGSGIWNNWITFPQNTTISGNIVLRQMAEPTEEEREERRQQELERLRRDRERRRQQDEEKEVVRLRAEQLLKTVLDDQQWESYEREKAFMLITQSGRQYRVRRGVSHNIELIEDGRGVETLCAHPNTSVYAEDQQWLGRLPAEDVVVAQVLALRTDEEGFRRTANILTYGPDEFQRLLAA